MGQDSFPGAGQHGGQPPLPGGPARDGDWPADTDARMAAFLADIEAGRELVPEPGPGPACTVSLGDAADVDLAGLAVMCGPQGLAGEAFAQDRAADAMRPGPVLSALAERAAGDLAGLSDNELLGAVSAARRLQNRAEYLELAGIAEFTRRRGAQLDAAKARKVPPGCRDGEFADTELAIELTVTPAAAGDRMDLAESLATRLPATFAALAAGVIDSGRAWTIFCYTRFLPDDLAAHADQILAAVAAGLRPEQLARRAAALEMTLDPEAARARREHARKEGQRVEARRELSGNASLAGRELAVADALAAKAHIDALAVRLRGAGLEGGLPRLRALVFTDLTQGRDPLARLTRPAFQPAPGGGQPGYPEDWPRGTGDDDTGPDDDADGEPGPGPKGPGTPAGGLAPLPALINLTIPAGTLLGWGTAPGQAGTWGLTDPADTRALVQAASAHPRTHWCLTVTGPDGTAAAHGCARGTRPWTPAPASGPGGGGGGRDGPDQYQAAQLLDLLARLNITPEPIAKGSCDHRHQEHRYTPSRMLQHLIRARTDRCTAPGCAAQAYCCDLDHTEPYPTGRTCQCGMAPACRRHHRCKQAPGWRLEQPAPGIMRWTLPSGRVYTTGPTIYDT